MPLSIRGPHGTIRPSFLRSASGIPSLRHVAEPRSQRLAKAAARRSAPRHSAGAIITEVARRGREAQRADAKRAEAFVLEIC